MEATYEKIGTYGLSETTQVEQTFIHSIKSLQQKKENLQKQITAAQKRITEVDALLAKAVELEVQEESE